MKKLVKVYGVFSVSANSMKELFRSTSKDLCKQFKKENEKKYKQLKIGYIDNIWQ